MKIVGILVGEVFLAGIKMNEGNAKRMNKKGLPDGWNGKPPI